MRGVVVRNLFPGNIHFKYDLTFPHDTIDDKSSVGIKEEIEKLTERLKKLKHDLPLKEASEKRWKLFLVKSTTESHHNGDISENHTLVCAKNFEEAANTLDPYHTVNSIERVTF